MRLLLLLLLLRRTDGGTQRTESFTAQAAARQVKADDGPPSHAQASAQTCAKLATRAAAGQVQQTQGGEKRQQLVQKGFQSRVAQMQGADG